MGRDSGWIEYDRLVCFGFWFCTLDCANRFRTREFQVLFAGDDGVISETTTRNDEKIRTISKVQRPEDDLNCCHFWIFRRRKCMLYWMRADFHLDYENIWTFLFLILQIRYWWGRCNRWGSNNKQPYGPANIIHVISITKTVQRTTKKA